MIFSFMVYAQERIVTGKVYDSSGESIIGASVMVQGTMQGVVTDIDGAFQLKVQPSQSLVISFLGYQDVILPVGSKNNFKIILEEDSSILESSFNTTLKSFPCLGAIVCGTYPTNEMTTFLPEGTCKANFPSKSVMVPLVVPFSMILAPMMGSPFLSFTTPLTVTVCCVISIFIDSAVP